MTDGGSPTRCWPTTARYRQSPVAVRAIERVKKIAAATGAADDPYFRERLAELDIDTVGFAAMFPTRRRSPMLSARSASTHRS